VDVAFCDFLRVDNDVSYTQKVGRRHPSQIQKSGSLDTFHETSLKEFLHVGTSIA
jgi:hypothetical protein